MNLPTVSRVFVVPLRQLAHKDEFGGSLFAALYTLARPWYERDIPVPYKKAISLITDVPTTRKHHSQYRKSSQNTEGGLNACCDR